MRILIVGAGALGGFIGAWLTRSGEDVVLFDVNPARARLLNDQGLLITRTGQEPVSVPVRAVSSLEGLAPFELVFIAVKTYQTEAAVHAVAAAAGPATRFLSMQNGIGNAETIAGLVGADRVLCGVTYHSIEHAGPGRLNYRAGIKPIQLAPCNGELTPEVHAIAEVFRRAGLDTNVVPNIDQVLWQKLLHNAAINPVSAVTGLTCREILADPDLLAFTRDLTEEILAVMRTRGVPIVDPEDPFRPILGSLKALGKNRPSMWQDLSRGNRTEVDAINGAIAAEAQRLGLRAPHNAALVHFIHSRERQKFLNKEELAARLGLAQRGLAPAGKRRAPLRRSVPRSGDGEPRAAALDGTGLLHDLLRAHYRDLEAAEENSTRLVAACSAFAPVELVRAFGLVPYFPEHHAALLAASPHAGHCFARAAAEGFSQFASSAMRVDLGALLRGCSPLVSSFGVSGPPRPDLMVYSTNTGPAVLRWFEFYGSYLDVPVLGMHAAAGSPLGLGERDAAVYQLMRLSIRLEQVTGRRLDYDRLAEVIGYSAAAAALWEEILELAQASPAPFSYFDLLTHLAPMLVLRGTVEAVRYYEQLKRELEQRISQGVAAVPGATHRFYWDGPPIWGAGRQLSRVFADAGIAVVASTFLASFALRGLDPQNPIDSMARVYAGSFDNWPAAHQVTWLAKQLDRYGADGVIYHDCRTTAEASHARYGLARQVERLSGVAALVLEADSHELRLFSPERLEQRLAEFLEQQTTAQAVS